MKSRAINDLSSVLGLPCWQVREDNQVGLDMNFGKPSMQVEEPRASRARSPRVRAMFARRRVFLRGTHWLAITPYRWTIQLGNGTKATSSSSQRRKDTVCDQLSGERLTAIVISPQSGSTQFYFDLDAKIVVRGNRAPGFSEFDIWRLHARKLGRFVAIHAGGGYRAGPLSGIGDGIHPLTAGAGPFLIIGAHPSSHVAHRSRSRAAPHNER